LNFLIHDEKSFKKQIKMLAETHFKLGITPDMFLKFGSVLTLTILAHLQLEPGSPEYKAVERHWRASYALISGEILKAMRATAPESRFSKKKWEPPQWLQDQLTEYKTYASLTMCLVKSKGNEEFMVAFYSKFFELSSASSSKFKNIAAQSHALWGALNSVVKLLETPAKMRGTMAALGKSHKGKGISREEYHYFVRALRVTFRSHLTSDYTEPMDAVWKQFLELLVMFMVSSTDTGCGLPSLSYQSLIPKSADGPEDSASRKSDSGKDKVLPVYDALINLESKEPSTDTLTTDAGTPPEGSTERTPEVICPVPSPRHRRTKNKLLDVAFFQKKLPGVPLPALQGEVQKLNDQLIYSSHQLANFSLAEIETIVAPATLKVLARYLAKES